MEYRIDYDNIDVADIMDQVKKKASERPPEPETPAPDASALPPAPAVPPRARPSRRPRLPPAAGGGCSRRTLRFFLRPYLPILIAADEWFRFRTNLPVNIRIDETATKLMERGMPSPRISTGPGGISRPDRNDQGNGQAPPQSLATTSSSS